jgi:hypothetical protein
MAKELGDLRFSEAKRIIDEAVAQFESSCRSAENAFRVERSIGDPYQKLADLARYHDVCIAGLGHLFEHGVVKEPPDELVKLVQLGVRPLFTVNGARCSWLSNHPYVYCILNAWIRLFSPSA